MDAGRCKAAQTQNNRPVDSKIDGEPTARRIAGTEKTTSRATLWNRCRLMRYGGNLTTRRGRTMFTRTTLIVLSAALVIGCGTGGDPKTQNNGEGTNGENNASSTNAGPNSASNGPNAQTNASPNNGTTAPNANTSAGDCVPDRDAFVTNALPEVEQYCGNCHGESPDFGAPVSLLDYDALVEGEVGERLVDEMATRLMDRSMPPAGSPRPLHTALDTMVEWATCGQQHADHTAGLEASRPLWTAPEDPPEGAESFDVTADEFALAPDTLDLYQCFVIEAPIDEPRLIRRIDPVIDDSRVLHHSLVKIDRNRDDDGASFDCYGFPPGEDYVYVWGPGQPSIEFPDGGVRIEPGDHFVLQIHYNNGAGAEGVMDSSGFRVFHEPVGGMEYGLFEIGSVFFPPIPAGQEGDTSVNCTVREDVELVASWPHMHEIGTEFSQVVEHADGTNETIIKLSGWSFEAQLIYDTPVSLREGDVLTTNCSWDNFKDFDVNPGLGTADEMCFNFMYVTPAVGSFCN